MVLVGEQIRWRPGWEGGAELASQRDQVPADLTNNASSINVSAWGDPMASYPSDQACNVTQFFKPQNLIFDITLCGVW